MTLKDISKGDRPDNLKHEVKGLDLVRRDWCPLSQRASGTVLDFILSGRPADEILDSIHGFLADLADRVRNGKVELRDYVITKSLTKAPEQYADKASQPHVQVMQRVLLLQLARVGGHAVCRGALGAACPRAFGGIIVEGQQ